MIAKQKDPGKASDKFTQAGDEAEAQMAYYLRRAFGDAPAVHVFNDLRLVDGDGDVAQIDHLVLHPYGIFVIESKSVSGEIHVNEHDEWIRTWNGRSQGMGSPIQQAKRQIELLRKLLNKHAEELRDKRLFGKIQPGFSRCPMSILVAISDHGIIRRKGETPAEVCKADHVCERIQGEMDRHRKGASLLAKPDGDYGLWVLRDAELSRVASFLLNHHQPLKPLPSEVAKPPKADEVTEPPPKPVTQSKASEAEEAVCKHCGTGDLWVTFGQYGYYFKCRKCHKNTPVDFTCKSCGRKARIRKQQLRFHRVCQACGNEQLVWVNTAEE